MSKISVILPVYNVENYLKICLDSILNQTFTDFELICVNDGSTDNSRKILEEYKNNDKRIIIIDKKNGGLSSARNAGLKAAKGEFICFIDSDDWVDKTMLEKLYKNITRQNTDISMCSVHLFDETLQKINDDSSYFNLSVFPESREQPDGAAAGCDTKLDFNDKVFSYKDTKNFTMDIPVMAWNKLYRRSFIEKCNARFPEGLIFEDGPFFFSLYFNTERVSLIRDFLYYYRINRAGSILQKGGEHLIDIIDVVNLMYENLKNSSIFDEIKYEFFKKKADDITYRYNFLPKKYKRKYRKKLNKTCCLINNKDFDYRYLLQNMPDAIYYKRLCDICGINTIINYKIQKFIIKLMYKIIQVLCTEGNAFYIKLWSLKFRIKKRAKFFDMWYSDDRIYVVLFNRIKFDFKFEYSKVKQ